MKNSLVRAVLLTASLFSFACSSAPSEPELGSKEQALIALDGSFDPEPDPGFDAAPPPPPPTTTTCSDRTDNGVCRRYCCTESTTFKRCGVVNCPSVIGPIIWGGGDLLMK